MAVAELETYDVTRGGPLCRVEQRLRILRGDRRDAVRLIAIVVLLAYVPFLLAGLRWRIATGEWPIALRELATHVRALVTLPLLLAGERLIEERARGAGQYLVRAGIVGDACIERYRAVIARTTRLRDSPVVEVLVFVLALASVVSTPSFTREVVPSIIWSIQPSALLYRFLTLRLLWRWLLWGLYLLQLARSPLTVRPTHPDRLAGLGPLADPSVAFGMVVMTGACVLAAAWGDRMRFEHVPPSAFFQVGLAYLVVSFLVASGPLWSFTAWLVRARHEGKRMYGALANRYSDALERRWIDRSGEEALGAQDFQALNDIGGSFERVQQIHPVLVTRPLLAAIVVAVALPMLPLVVAEVGTATLLARLARALL